MARTKAKRKPKLSSFEIAQRHAEADLMAVAELFVNAAEAVAKGDMGRMDVTVERMSMWRDMLLIRHASRMDELRAQDNQPARALAEQPTEPK